MSYATRTKPRAKKSRAKRTTKRPTKRQGETVASSHRATCPNCDKNKLIPEGDYLCKDCRKEETGTFRVQIPETNLQVVDHEQLLKLLPMLISHKMSFSVEAPE
jgi:hypothetical protein